MDIKLNGFMDDKSVKVYSMYLMLKLLAKTEGKPYPAGNMFYRYIVYSQHVTENPVDVRALLDYCRMDDEAKDVIMKHLSSLPVADKASALSSTALIAAAGFPTDLVDELTTPDGGGGAPKTRSTTAKEKKEKEMKNTPSSKDIKTEETSIDADTDSNKEDDDVNLIKPPPSTSTKSRGGRRRNSSSSPNRKRSTPAKSTSPNKKLRSTTSTPTPVHQARLGSQSGLQPLALVPNNKVEHTLTHFLFLLHSSYHFHFPPFFFFPLSVMLRLFPPRSTPTASS